MSRLNCYPLNYCYPFNYCHPLNYCYPSNYCHPRAGGDPVQSNTILLKSWITASAEMRFLSVRSIRLLVTIIAILFRTNLAPANEIIISGGKFGIDEQQNNYEAGLEHRWSEQLWHFKPLIGAFANSKSGGFFYAGVSFDFAITNNLELGVGIAPGIYHKGHGKSLGGPVDIKSQLELWWVFGDQYKLGAAIAHLSHSGLYKSNPGIETVSAQMSIPF